MIRRADDERRELVAFRGSVAAINGENSNSGMNLFRAAIAPIAMGAFFAKVVATGSHVASLRAVAAGEADLAAVDCVSFALITREQPSAERANRDRGAHCVVTVPALHRELAASARDARGRP